MLVCMSDTFIKLFVMSYEFIITLIYPFQNLVMHFQLINPFFLNFTYSLDYAFINF